MDVSVDTGPDTISARPPVLRGLIEDLGLADAVVTPGVSGSYLWSRGRLRRVPTGPLLGVSVSPWQLLRSQLLSPLGIVRAGLDLVLPRTRLAADPSVREVFHSRLGEQVCQRLVAPMLAGAYSGSIDQLSAHSVVSEFEALARNNRSLYLAMRRHATRKQGSGPMFTTLQGGLGRLIDALRAELADCDVRLGTAVSMVEKTARGYLLGLGGDARLEADAVVIAAPAHAAAGMLDTLSPTIASALRSISYSDITTVTLAYPPDAINRPLDATGFLVPPVDGRLLQGCTWLSAKWPPLGGHPFTPIRCLLGERAASMSDQDLTRRVHEELVEAMGVTKAPLDAVITRWSRALPQYTLGHQSRLEGIDLALASLPGLYLTGAAYRGAGVAYCVAQAQQTANNVAANLRIPVHEQRMLP
jgi:oxygen-dependent protoporphyrinogen oxidase